MQEEELAEVESRVREEERQKYADLRDKFEADRLAEEEEKRREESARQREKALADKLAASSLATERADRATDAEGEKRRAEKLAAQRDADRIAEQKRLEGYEERIAAAKKAEESARRAEEDLRRREKEIERKLAAAKAPTADTESRASTKDDDSSTLSGIMDESVARTMRLYESAYEALNFSQLSLVWKMNTMDRKVVRDLFDDCSTIKLSLNVLDSEVSGKKAKVLYDERIVGKKCKSNRTFSQYAELKADLVLRGGSEWQIVRLRDRK